MPAKRWANQDTYASAIEAHAADNGVPAALAYGLIALESQGFNANAIRQEPTYYCSATGTMGDASYGLTQVLYCTALGLGYTGTPGGLLDIETNLQLGMTLLGRLLRSHNGDVGAALSAYNGGDRHSLGYGARRADGTFANQQYVDNIQSNADYFESYLAGRDSAQTAVDPDPDADSIDQGDGTASDGPGGSADPLSIAVGVIGAGALLGAVLRALRH